MPGFPVHNQLPQLAYTHAHQVGDASQPFHPLLTLLQTFPASGSFPMSQLFISAGQSVRASASVLPMNIQDWFPLELAGLISSQSKGLSWVFSNTTVWNHQFVGTWPSLRPNSHIHTWLPGKTIALTIWTFVGKVMSLLLNTLSRFAIVFLEGEGIF